MQNITSLHPGNAADWQLELANAITCADELLAELDLRHLANELVHKPAFRLLVPRGFAAKMQKGNADDPLLKQVLPMVAENSPHGITDPVGDLDAMATPGLLHKYRGRALLVTTGACAIHCRYCFRRHFPYANANPGKKEWGDAIAYLSAHEDVHEVILSGGDPLVLDNAKLGRLLNALEQIPHIKWLRVHTRLPVVLPSRVDEELVALLHKLRLRKTFVIHANHANELGTDEYAALDKLQSCGMTLLNQSVLLKGINDSSTALIDLSQSLYEAGVLPYYLHMLDPVQGAMHFDVSQPRAVELIAALQKQLPGYLVPRLVRENPGAASKTAIFTI
jgi:EF-P beta-lysylation protein EpmB